MAVSEWGDTPWQLAYRDGGALEAPAFSVTLAGRTVHLHRLAESDWCACDGVCAACGNPTVIQPSDGAAPSLRCQACQAVTPLIQSSDNALACMVVDDEVYVLLDEKAG